MKRERKAVQRCCTSSQAFRSPSTAATCLEADSWEEFDVWLKANPHTIELYTNIHKQHKWHDMSTRSLCLFTTQHGIQVLAKLLLLTSKLLSVCVCVCAIVPQSLWCIESFAIREGIWTQNRHFQNIQSLERNSWDSRPHGVLLCK